MIKQLHVDWDGLTEAFQNAFPFELNYYLDLETGEVQLVTDEARRHLERLVEEYAEEHGEEEFDLDRVLESSGLHDWQKQGVREADEVEADYGGRYIAVPQDETREAYEDIHGRLRQHRVRPTPEESTISRHPGSRRLSLLQRRSLRSSQRAAAMVCIFRSGTSQADSFLVKIQGH